MGAFTYINPWEAREWNTVKDDKRLDELLQEIRRESGRDWLVQVREIHAPIRRKWGILNVFLKPKYRTFKTYTLYLCVSEPEYQVINLVTSHSDSGSVFSFGDRAGVMNFFLGYLSGLDDAKRNQGQTPGGSAYSPVPG